MSFLLFDFSPFHSVQVGSGAHPASCPMGTGAKRQVLETDHSPPSNAEVKTVMLYLHSL
jgi:hypothetical protein